MAKTKKHMIHDYVPGKTDILTTGIGIKRFLSRFACPSDDYNTINNYLLQHYKTAADIEGISLMDISNFLKTKNGRNLSQDNVSWLFARLIEYIDASESDRIRIAILGFETIRNTLVYCKYLFPSTIHDINFIAMAVILRDDIEYFVDNSCILDDIIVDVSGILETYLRKPRSFDKRIKLIRFSKQAMEYVSHHPDMFTAKEWKRILDRLQHIDIPVTVVANVIDDHISINYTSAVPRQNMPAYRLVSSSIEEVVCCTIFSMDYSQFLRFFRKR